MSERIEHLTTPQVEAAVCESPALIEPQAPEPEDESLIFIPWSPERARIRAAAKEYLEGSYADDRDSGS